MTDSEFKYVKDTFNKNGNTCCFYKQTFIGCSKCFIFRTLLELKILKEGEDSGCNSTSSFIACEYLLSKYTPIKMLKDILKINE